MSDLNIKECLTALTSKPRERKIVVYDLESKHDETQKPGFTRVFLAGVYDGTRFISFRNHPALQDNEMWWQRARLDGGCIDQMMRYLLTKDYRGHYIYAHNGGAFDHLHILPWLTDHLEEFSYTIIPTQSSIQVLKVRELATHHTWTFLDSFKLLPMGLDKILKTMGYTGKVKHNLATHENNEKVWEKYLKGDCVKLHKSLEKFQYIVKDVMGGELGITLPATAMKLYRRKYMGQGMAPAILEQHRHFKECNGMKQQASDIAPIPPEPCHACLHDWIRAGYHGGRTEAFRTFGRKLTYYDINSSYPRSMLEDMPAGTCKQYGPKKGIEDFFRIENQAIGFVECEVYIPSTCYLPPLPLRDEQRNKLIFPTGTFRGVWAWDELKLLFDPLVGGSIKQVFRSVWYQRKTLFFDYVKDMYCYRDKSLPDYDEGLSLVAKLMLVSLYGKFGMNEDRDEIVVLGQGEMPPEGSTQPMFEDGTDDLLSSVCFVKKKITAPYILPQISAQITALSRIRLWLILADVIRRNGKIYYCDTDSVITNLTDLPVSTQLGDLKNELPGEVVDVQILGAKAYILRKETVFLGEHLPSCESFKGKESKCTGCSKVKLVMKGVPKNIRTEETFEKLLTGGTLEFDRLEKLGAMAEKGFKEGPRMRTVKKSHNAEQNNKRVFTDGGEDSRPIHIVPTDEGKEICLKRKSSTLTRSRAIPFEL